MIRKISLFVLSAMIFVACNQNRIYDKNIQIDKDTWALTDTLKYNFNIKDTLQAYDIRVNVRNNIDYPFQNLHIKYNLEDSSKHPITSGSVDLKLFEAKTGKPLGEGVGGIYDVTKDFLNNYKFNNSGEYTLEIVHNMRDHSLLGIRSVGIQVDKFDNKLKN